MGSQRLAALSHIRWHELQKTVLIQCRPHVAVAAGSTAICWLLAAVAVRRVVNNNRRKLSAAPCSFPAALLTLWLAQAACTSAAAMSQAAMKIASGGKLDVQVSHQCSFASNFDPAGSYCNSAFL